MTNSILLQNLTPESLAELIKEGVKSQLEEFKKNFISNDPVELLTRKQTCQFLQIDITTLWTWTKKGKVMAHGIGNRRYYKRTELLEALKPLNK